MIQTDRDACQVIAGHVEYGSMHEALTVLVGSRLGQVTRDVFVYDATDARPSLTIDLEGEDGNAFFLVAKAICALMKTGCEASACELLDAYDMSKSYEDLVSLVQRSVLLENTPTQRVPPTGKDTGFDLS